MTTALEKLVALNTLRGTSPEVINMDPETLVIPLIILRAINRVVALVAVMIHTLGVDQDMVTMTRRKVCTHIESPGWVPLMASRAYMNPKTLPKTKSSTKWGGFSTRTRKTHLKAMEETKAPREAMAVTTKTTRDVYNPRGASCADRM